MGAAETKSAVNAGVIVVALLVLAGAIIYAAKTFKLGPGGHVVNNTTANYARIMCDDAYLSDNSSEANKNPPYFDVPLKDGCFSGFVTIPRQWTDWQVQFRGDDPSDWVAEWYSGWVNPAGPYGQAAVNSGRISFSNVPSKLVSFEGKGTVRIYRITGNGPTSSDGGTETPPPRVEEPQPNVKHPAPQKPIVMIPPVSGADTDYSVELAECKHESQTIECWGFAKNKTDATTRIFLRNGSAVDDEGNSFNIPWGDFDQRGDWQQDLMPGVNTRFHITIRDPHQNVKTINLEWRTSWGHLPERYTVLVFKDVPVQ